MKTLLKSVMASAVIAVSAAPVLAQEQSTNRVFAKTDWSVFVEDNPTQCWVVSSPTGTKNTRDGRVVAVNRGDILMFVSFWPGSGKLGEVSFAGGYPFAEGSTVSLSIGDDKFDLFTSGETAWAADSNADKSIIAAMKKGISAVVSGRSTRGTRTEDTFSLRGFTAAIDDAQKRCS
ncbi:MAG: hypothetical protein JXR14_15075 [Paracoccaceae bacterium]